MGGRLHSVCWGLGGAVLVLCRRALAYAGSEASQSSRGLVGARFVRPPSLCRRGPAVLELRWAWLQEGGGNVGGGIVGSPQAVYLCWGTGGKWCLSTPLFLKESPNISVPGITLRGKQLSLPYGPRFLPAAASVLDLCPTASVGGDSVSSSLPRTRLLNFQIPGFKSAGFKNS